MKTVLSVLKEISKQNAPESYSIVYTGNPVAFSCCGNPQRIPIYNYQDAPDFLHGNPYLIHGYRGRLSLALCIRSLFAWSNDTFNIWSHLIGFWIFFFLMIYDNLVEIPRYHGTMLDHVVLTVALCCFQFCLLCSTGYHLFRCHSERAFIGWLSLDLTGISVGLLGCYLPGIHYGFYCLSVWRDIYMVFFGLLFIAVLYWQTSPQYYSPSWFRKRTLLYLGLTIYGVLPSLHWVLLNGGVKSHIVQLFAPKIVAMYLIGMAAFFFWISKFPECFFPGRFDYIGSSHQFWHVIVIFGFLHWHYSGKQLLVYRVHHPCFT